MRERLPALDPHTDILVVPILGRLRARFGEGARLVSPGEAVLIPNGVANTLEIEPSIAGTWYLTFALARGLGALKAQEAGCVDLPPGALAWFRGAVRFIRQGATQPSFLPLSVIPDFVKLMASQPRLPLGVARLNPGFRRALALVQMPRALDMARLVRESGQTYGVLRRHFLRETGCTPRQYSLAWRLEAAASVLRQNPGAPLGPLAAQYGFTDVAEFRRLYRRRFGLSSGLAGSSKA